MPEGQSTQDPNQSSSTQTSTTQQPDIAATTGMKTIMVDGKTKQLTEEEQTKYMQLGFSSTQRYEDAKKLNDSLAPLLRVKDIFKRQKEGQEISDSELTEIANAFGLDIGEFSAAVKGSDKTPPLIGTPSPAAEIDVSKLPEKTRRAIEFAEQQMYEKEIAKVKNYCKETVGKDPIFGKMISGITDESKKEGIVQIIVDYVFNDVQLKALYGQQYGPDLVASAIQEARNHFQKVGILYKASEQPTPNFGGGLGSLDSATRAEITATEPIKRIPSTEPSYEATEAKRFLRRVFGGASK